MRRISEVSARQSRKGSKSPPLGLPRGVRVPKTAAETNIPASCCPFGAPNKFRILGCLKSKMLWLYLSSHLTRPGNR